MKMVFTVLALLTCTLSGCYREDLSPRANVVENGTGGFWKLSGYTIRDKDRPISDAAPLTLVEIKTAKVSPNDHFASSVFRAGVDYNIFVYSQTPERETVSINALRWDHHFSKSQKQETSWFKIDDDTGFLVILDVDVTVATSSKMQVSNIIKSSEYKAELDTARYIYVPADSWH